MSDDAGASAKVDLAHLPDFTLGGVEVSPSGCRVRMGARDERLEPRVMQVLVVLARAAGGTVTRDELVDACWDGRIVGEDAITRTIAKVRNLARDFEPAPFVLETIPKIGFRLVAADAAAAGSGAARAGDRRRRRVAFLAVAAVAMGLLVAAGGWLVWRTLASALPASQNGRVEVMAFEARRPEPELQRLAGSLDDGVMRGLARAGIATAPHVANKDDGSGSSDAEFRVVGAVDREDEAFVVNLQLLERRSGIVLWSTRMDRPAASLKGFEDSVGRHVAAALQCMLEDRALYPRPMDAATIQNYLNGCEAIDVGNPHRALEFARRLVKQRPDLPGPHAVYGIGLAFIAWETEDPKEAEALRREARASAQRALRIHPRYPEAYQAIAISYPDGGDWAPREAAMERVRELDPNFVPGHIVYVGLLRETGRIKKAYEVASRAAAGPDPRAGGLQQIQLTAELRGPAAAEVEVARLDDPDAARAARRGLAIWSLAPGEGRVAVRDLFDPHHSPAYRACVDAHLAALERNKGTVVRGLSAGCARTSFDTRIRMLARQGDLDGAFAEASKPTSEVGRTTTMHFFYPEMRAFRADPRFMPLAARLGLVDYWRTSGHWPDFCSEPDLPYDCKAVARSLASSAAGPAK